MRFVPCCVRAAVAASLFIVVGVAGAQESPDTNRKVASGGIQAKGWMGKITDPTAPISAPPTAGASGLHANGNSGG